jgi:UDP-N-acetylmuramate dehydrogenase
MLFEAKIPVSSNLPLSTLSRWQIGGPADLVVEPESAEQVSYIMRLVHDLGVLSVIIGDGSNLLFDDAGFRGLVIRIGARMAGVQFDESGTVRAGAGTWVPHYVRTVSRAGFSGCTHAIGIPGTLGGLVIMNGGSQRRGIGDQLVSVQLVDENGDLINLTRNQCLFSYRYCSLQNRKVVVVGAEFRYEKGEWPLLRKEMLEILSERNRKFPRKLPNCGSTFLSDPSMYSTVGPPGKAIEESGLKGLRRGGAQISPMHANFIVNTGGAKSADVLWLISEVRSQVFRRTGYEMNCEVRYVSADGHIRPAHEPADDMWGAPASRGRIA